MWRRRAATALSPLLSSSPSSSSSSAAAAAAATTTTLSKLFDQNSKHRQCRRHGLLNSTNSPAFFATAVQELIKEDDAKRIKPFIAFVLGGPGSGKGTQCLKIAEAFGFKHLSAGDLLREEISCGSEKGSLIRDIIKDGRIVPSEITVSLIQKAIRSSENNKILIDGFPRSEENRIAFERIVGVEPDLVISFICPEEEMVKRVLSRNQGRIDDNIDTVKKRLKVYENFNVPVIDYYASKGKVCKVNAMGSVDEIFERVSRLFSSLREKEERKLNEEDQSSELRYLNRRDCCRPLALE